MDKEQAPIVRSLTSLLRDGGYWGWIGPSGHTQKFGADRWIVGTRGEIGEEGSKHRSRVSCDASCGPLICLDTVDRKLSLVPGLHYTADTPNKVACDGDNRIGANVRR
jgi:hypothetical protein